MLKTDSAFIGRPDSKKPFTTNMPDVLSRLAKNIDLDGFHFLYASYPTIQSTTVQIINTKVNSNNDSSTGRKIVRQGLR